MAESYVISTLARNRVEVIPAVARLVRLVLERTANTHLACRAPRIVHNRIGLRLDDVTTLKTTERNRVPLIHLVRPKAAAIHVEVAGGGVRIGRQAHNAEVLLALDFVNVLVWIFRHHPLPNFR